MADLVFIELLTYYHETDAKQVCIPSGLRHSSDDKSRPHIQRVLSALRSLQISAEPGCFNMNGAPLLMDHGAPLRLRAETKLGSKGSKWIKTIALVDYYGSRAET